MTANLCGCGCGVEVAGQFKRGHSARLPRNTERDEKIRDLSANGETYSAIGKAYGMTRQGVRNIVKGQPPVRPNPTRFRPKPRNGLCLCGCGEAVTNRYKAGHQRRVNPIATVSGKAHPFWKGDAASTTTKRERAQKLYLLAACEICGAKAVDRHHIDGDTGNNTPENIARLCRRCHMTVDGRLAVFARHEVGSPQEESAQ